MLTSLQRNPFRFAFALIAIAVPTAAQTVWDVGPGIDNDFQNLQDAIDAASDGDVIVADPNVYDAFHVQGKGLRMHLAGSTIFNVIVSGSTQPAVRVSDTGPDQLVSIEGLNVITAIPDVPSAVQIANCAGPVWMHNFFLDSFGAPSLHVMNSDSVVLSDGRLQTISGQPGPMGEPMPAAGALVEGGSRLFAYRVDFTGSHAVLVTAGVPLVTGPQQGGDGITLIDSSAVLHGGFVRGGAGSTFFTDCPVGADGGAGVRLQTTGLQESFLRFTGTDIKGGSPGFSEPCAPPATGGARIEQGTGVVEDTQQDPRLVSFDIGVVEPGTTLRIEAEGATGDLVFLFASLEGSTAQAFSTGFLFGDVELHLASASLVTLTSAAISSGTSLVLEPLAPALPPGVEAVTLALQGLVLDGTTFFPHTAMPYGVTIR